MKNIRISLINPAIPAGSGLVHTATSYQVSRTLDFNNTNELLVNRLLDTTNLLDYRTQINITKYDTVYVRSRYHFNNNRASNWSRITPLHGDQIGLSIANTVINTPILNTSINYLNNINGELTITTNEMRLYNGAGNHLSTSWLVATTDGEVLFERERDESNLTKLTITLTKQYTSTLVIKAKHHTDTSAVSNYGKILYSAHIRENRLFKLTPHKRLTVDRRLFFKLDVFSTRFKHLDILLKDANGAIVKNVSGVTTLTPNIHMNGIIPYKVYRLEARVITTDGDTEAYTFIKEFVAEENYLNNYNPMLTYLNRFSHTQDIIQGGGTVQHTYQHYNGRVLLAKHNDNNLYEHKIVNGKLVEISAVIKLTNDIVGLPFVSVLPLHNGNVIVCHTLAAANGQTTVFSKYDYNPLTNKYVMSGERVVPTERYGVAIANSCVVGRDDNIYYIPSRKIDTNNNYIDLNLRKLDTNTMVVSDLANLPFNAKKNVGLSIDNNNQIIIFGGSNNNNNETSLLSNRTIFGYNIITNKFQTIGSLPVEIPNSMYTLQGVLRRDGKVVLFNGARTGASVGDQSTVVIDTVDKIIKYENSDYQDNLPYRNTVRLLNGDILRVSSTVLEMQRVYTYISNTIRNRDITEPIGQPYELLGANSLKHLVVSNNRTITVESLYDYDKVTIETGSTLRWTDNGVTRVFNHKDLIITRDTVMSEADYINGEWGGVNIINNATFDIIPAIS